VDTPDGYRMTHAAGGQTKREAKNAAARRVLVELDWAYPQPPPPAAANADANTVAWQSAMVEWMRDVSARLDALERA